MVDYDVTANQFEVVTFELAAGPQIVEFLLREDDVQLDRVALTEVALSDIEDSDEIVAGVDESRLENDIDPEIEQRERKLYLPLYQ